MYVLSLPVNFHQHKIFLALPGTIHSFIYSELILGKKFKNIFKHKKQNLDSTLNKDMGLYFL